VKRPPPSLDPLEPDLDRASYDSSFTSWAETVVARKARLKPELRPYPLANFDGCSGIPDDARWACLIHDVDYWYVQTPEERLEADRRLRDNLIDMGRFDPAWHWLWRLRGWLWFVAVRAIGARFAGGGSRPPGSVPQGGLP
jgi:hypothetical protein